MKKIDPIVRKIDTASALKMEYKKINKKKHYENGRLVIVEELVAMTAKEIIKDKIEQLKLKLIQTGLTESEEKKLQLLIL